MNFESSLLPAITALIFGAGGTYFWIKQSRKDVDGLGGKFGREAKQSACRHHNITMAILCVAKDDEMRFKLAEILKEPVD